MEYAKISSEADIGKLTVRQLRSMFISYTMSVNIQEKRTGALFESKYKRLDIKTEEYLRYVIFYTHYNPEKHGIGENFKEYRFSSFQTFLSNKPTKIDRELVLNIYGDKSDFENYHAFLHDEKEFVDIE